ncbi:MAG: hypothetical protein JST54_23960 [Deltaproteobacteria bacterium]|nr:hypothetical protein [Deltaproteobacteria bacterium]
MTFAPIALGLLLAASPGDAKVFDRVVATLDGEVITLSELEFESRVETIERGGQDAALDALPHQTLAQNLTLAISNRLAAREAQRLGIYDVSGDQLNAAVVKFTGNLPIGLDQFLALNEVTRPEFEHLLRRDIQVNNYLTSRTQLHAPISDAEVDRAIAQQAADKTAKSSKVVRDKVRQDLTEARNAQLVLAELRRLYARAKVRIVDPNFSGADALMLPAAPGG